jgi:hypothetical protein
MERNGKGSAPLPFPVGAQHAVPGADAWRTAAHTPSDVLTGYAQQVLLIAALENFEVHRSSVSTEVVPCGK